MIYTKIYAVIRYFDYKIYYASFFSHRNSSEPISIGELSMFVNALIVTCHNPRQFHGYDLIKILYERASMAKMPCPGAYLTLCNSDWILSSLDVIYLLELLQKDADLPFFIGKLPFTIFYILDAHLKN